MQVLVIASSLLVAAFAGITVNAASAAQNETRVLQSSGTCLAPEYHFDFPGNDVGSVHASSFDQCCTPCYQSRYCGAYTWTNYDGGTCWLKSWRSRSDWKGANSDGSANTVSVELNRCNKRLTKDQDLIGIEVGSSAGGDHPESCCVQCSLRAVEGCKGFAWTDYNGGTCWFKGGSLQAVYKPGVSSFVFGA